ncbi:MAG: M14 family metallocarboxypeptidase [Defluviitaleaceae bacterium]|nr:M14 family metallocarboxypeptidase [Defluviitaleaceae bacterium]MCL2240394.1 M14 family metallocarboxypeptidase [Defluviitaleaceae bacterium]
MFSSQNLSQRAAVLAREYPFADVESIGTSRLGRPLYALRVGYGNIAVGFNAAHHANEWITAPLLMQFMEEYCQACAKDPAYLERFALYAIPLVNPDGAEWVITGEKSGQWKANACGVDLNSNYPASWELARQNKFAQGFTAPGPKGYVGPAPLSEPESSAMVAYTLLRDFALTVSLHTQGEEIYWRYRHFNPPGAQKIAADMERVSGYLCVDVPDEASHGGYRDWFIQHFNRPGFTLECGLGESPLPIQDFDGIYKKVAPMLWAALDGI